MDDDITPLVWEPFAVRPLPPLRIPISENKAVDEFATIIMERRYHHLRVLSAWPPNEFVHGNELSLKVTETTAQSLRVMIIQNERGKGRIAISLFLFGPNLCLACSEIIADKDAEVVHGGFLSQGASFTGFLALPFRSREESSMYRGGFFLSLECVSAGALTYRFTIGPSYRDTLYSAGNILAGGGVQVNMKFDVSPMFFDIAVSQNSGEDSVRAWRSALYYFLQRHGAISPVTSLTDVVARRRQELVEESMRIPGGLCYYDSGDLGTVGHCVVKAEEAESTITKNSCQQEGD